MGRPSGHRPLPMVEMCEEWNSLSVKRHSRQVLPTPESPISSRRNSTSYCFAMARAGGDRGLRAGGGLSPARPLPSRRAPTQGRRGRRGRSRVGPRAGLARSLGAGMRGREESAAPPPAPSPAPPPERGGSAPESGDPAAGARPARAPRPEGAPLKPSVRAPGPGGNVLGFLRTF